MFISTRSISYENIKRDIVNFIQGRPTYARWKDFYDGNIGKTLIEFYAGMGTYVASSVIVQKREVLLQYAQNRASLLGICEGLNYSIYRGQNAKLTIYMTPIVDITLDAYDSIGTVGESDLLLLQSTVLSTGVPTSFDVILGKLEYNELDVLDFPQKSINITSSDLNVFRFSAKDVSETIKLYLNSSEVPVSKDVIDLGNDKYIALSNATGGVDVFYWNTDTATYRYDIGDVLTLKYLTLLDTDYTVGEFNLTYGDLDSYTVIQPFKPYEPNYEVRIKAPLYHEVQKVLRGREDYKKALRTYIQGIIDVEGYDVTPAVVELAYTKEDKTVLSPVEQTEFYNLYESMRRFDTAPPVLRTSIFHYIDLSISAILLDSGYTATNVYDDILEKISAYEDILGKNLDLYDLENLIEELDYIKIARASVGTGVWQAATQYQMGAIVSHPSGGTKLYRLKAFDYKSGSSSPAWTTTFGDEIIDNDIIWKTYYRRNVDTYWSPSTNYRINDLVKITTVGYEDVMYKCIGFLRPSGAVMPTWNSTSITFDNSLVWSEITFDTLHDLWQPSTNYRIGDIVKSDSPENRSFTCVGFLGTSGGSTPFFGGTVSDETLDNDIYWETYENSTNLYPLEWNSYINFNPTITLS